MSITATAASTHATDRFCTFWAGGLYFGVAVLNVQEVLRSQAMSPAPRAPQSVRGLLNLRGQIVTAVDLRHRLGLAPRAVDSDCMNVVIRSRGEIVSLLVDAIGDVIDTTGAVLEPAALSLPSALRGAIAGVISLPDSILLVLDADRAADVAPANNPGGTQ